MTASRIALSDYPVELKSYQQPVPARWGLFE